MSAKTPEEPQPQNEHPKEHDGLAEKLKNILGGRPDSPKGQISEGSQILDNSAEHQKMVDQLEQKRSEKSQTGAEAAKLRAQALEELGGSSGVVTGGSDAIEQKVAEIQARNADASQRNNPAA